MICTTSNYFPDIVKGQTFTGCKMTIYDGVGDAKTPRDLTGASVSIPFKKGAGQNTIFLFSTEDGTITIPDPTNGEIFLQPRDMNYPAFNYIFELTVTFASGTKKPYFTNFWKICQNV